MRGILQVLDNARVRSVERVLQFLEMFLVVLSGDIALETLDYPFYALDALVHGADLVTMGGVDSDKLLLFVE